MFFFATLIAIAYSDVPFGTNLGSNNNVIGYSNLNSDFVSNNDSYISVTLSTKEEQPIFTGMQWQCVEYARRWLIINKNLTFESIDNAYQIWNIPNLISSTNSSTYPLYQVPNGSKCPPAVGNILIYSYAKNNPTGHVAIITEVDTEFIKVSEQNWDNNYWPGDYARIINFTHSNETYQLYTEGYPIHGWLVYENYDEKECIGLAIGVSWVLFQLFLE